MRVRENRARRAVQRLRRSWRGSAHAGARTRRSAARRATPRGRPSARSDRSVARCRRAPALPATGRRWSVVAQLRCAWPTDTGADLPSATSDVVSWTPRSPSPSTVARATASLVVRGMRTSAPSRSTGTCWLPNTCPSATAWATSSPGARPQIQAHDQRWLGRPHGDQHPLPVVVSTAPSAR